MQHSFVFKSKPFSINKATYGDARTKTQDYYQWAGCLFHEFWRADNQLKFKELREFFDDSKHSFNVELKCFYPKDTYITKAGILSSKTTDTSNWEKLFLDLLFDERFHNKPHPNGAPNVNQDDKHIVRMVSEKTFHDGEPLLEAVISIVPRLF